MSSLRSGVRLGLDWGEARTGVAACDPAGTLAYPLGAVPAGPDEVAELARLVEEYDPVEVVVGLPRSLSGREGPAAVRVRARTARLAEALRHSAPQVTVRLVDERLTTVAAARQLQERGVRARKQRHVIDATAAAGILQHALDAERAGLGPPGELVSPGPVRKDDAAEGTGL